MSLHDAGILLNKQLRTQFWFQAVGVAEPDTLFVYTQTRVPKHVDKFKEYEGYKVKWRFVGKITAGPHYG